MPDLASMIEIALQEGDVEAITGQRHFSGTPVIKWDPAYNQDHTTPVFHTYGYGGSGLTLAPSVANYVGKKISDQAVLLDT